MKKFLTFFAMLCVLLGFSPQLSAAVGSYTIYADCSNNGWTTPWLIAGEPSTYWVAAQGEHVDGTASIYKFTFTYGNENENKFDRFSFVSSKPTIPSGGLSNLSSYSWGTTINGEYKTGNTGEYKAENGHIYYLNSGNGNSDHKTYTPPAAPTYPDLYFVGYQNSWTASNDYKFDRTGSVYTLTIPAGIYENASNPNGSNNGWKIWEGTKSGDNWTGVIFGAPNETDNTPLNNVAFDLTKGSGSKNLRTVTGGKSATLTLNYSATGTSTITVTWATKPATPVISKEGNTVTITCPGNFYYTIDGSDPKTSSTRTYVTSKSTSFELNASSVTVRAASTDGSEWSNEATETYSYGMPVPTITIENGVVTITVNPVVEGAKIMYSIDNNSCNDEYEASFNVTEGQTVYAQYTSTVFGSSTVVSKAYTTAPTIQKIELYNRYDAQQGNDPINVTTSASSDGVWYLGSYTNGGSNEWTKWMCIKVTYDGGTEAEWISPSNDDAVSIEPGSWLTAYAHTDWNMSSSTKYGFYVNQSDTKTVGIYLKVDGDQMQIMAKVIEKQNYVTFGGKAPSVAGYNNIGNNSWDSFVEFDKVSNTKYKHDFTPSGSNGEFILKINDKYYQPNANQGNNQSVSLQLSNGEAETYKFNRNDVSNPNDVKRCELQGMTIGSKYTMELEETEEGMRLTVYEISAPKPPVYKRATGANTVTVDIPSGCTLHYSVNDGEWQTATTSPLTIAIPAEGVKLNSYFTKQINGETLNGEAVTEQFEYYDKSKEWPVITWSLSGAMKDGEVKYFYLSDYQNDNRVSPEWEMIKSGDTYTLKNFMVIPAASFVVRRIAKDMSGNLSYSDYGISSYTDLHPVDFNVPATATEADRREYTSNALTLSKDASAGYTWDIGYSMVTVTIEDATSASDTAPGSVSATLTVDFSQPSTAQCAPIPGMPYVALTGSKLEVPTIGGQPAIKHAATLDSKHPEYQNAFTNAWIQYDKDSKMYVYGAETTGAFKDADNTEKSGIYYRGSFHRPAAGAVMSSTIMPPRYPICFKLTDAEGNVSNVTSNKTILKYKGQEPRTFTAPNGKATKENVKFAVYTLNDMEMAGLFKIYSGYGARDYGATTNGLSLFNNWGVGWQPSDDPYGHSEVTSGVSYPLCGGGPRTDDKGQAWRAGGSDVGSGVDASKEDNYAGRYFGFDTRTYVSELNFYYALERDNEGNLDGSTGTSDYDKTDYNTHHTDGDTKTVDSYTNNGRNYSWYRFGFVGSFGQITLDKVGPDSGLVKWAINKDGRGQDDIIKYKVVFYEVNPETGEPIGTPVEIVPETICPDGTKQIPETPSTQTNLKPGWYEAQLEYTLKDADTGEVLPKVATSSRILIFNLDKVSITAEQLITHIDESGNEVGENEGMTVYHPVIVVTPDLAGALADAEASLAADQSTTLTLATAASAKIEISGLRDVSELALDDATTSTQVAYDRTSGTATITYPVGFFTTSSDIPTMSFRINHAAVGAETAFKLTLHVEGVAGDDATDTDTETVYMPGGKLYGKLEPQAVNSDVNSNVEFNALAVTNQDDLPHGEANDGYARIRYVDAEGNLCGIGTVDATAVMAEIKYIGNDGTKKTLFGGEKLDMRLNPDDPDAVYTAKRLKIAGIPYETEEATDAAGESIKVRKDQTAKFAVELTYSASSPTGFNETTLTYEAKELTSPRKDLADLKTKDDKRGETNADGKTIATDVTAISESWIENYGGLITNIEDAHVALAAVAKKEGLIGYDSFDKWYMDHGDKYDDGKVNPHAPVNRRAIGHKNLTGTTTFATPAEVHPLLREDGAPVTVASDFQNTSTVNNAWWNSAASVAPAFHKNDHIKGDFVRDGKGNITGWTSESTIQKPNQHREYWAGVKAGNNNAYKNVWNGGIIERENGVSVDVRDPKHGYYDMASHFASVTEDGVEKPVRSAYYLGEMPLNANDVMALYGSSADPHGVASFLGDYADLRSVVLPIHEQMSEEIAKAKFTDCKASVTIDGVTYKLDYPADEPWNYGNTWKTRAALAFSSSNAAGLAGKSPAEAIFATANKHMIFKVNHVNHESWFVPNGIPQGTPKTYSLWEAFKGKSFGGVAFNDLTTDKQKDDYIMSVIRMELDDYCPLAYDVRYTYPFLTVEKVTAENYNNAKTRAAATEDFNRINTMLAAVTPEEVTPVAARDTGRVPFFGTMTASPEEIVPTAISDVNDDIRGAGFSIVYNRAAGTVTITADGDRELKDAAVYDATGASLVSGTSADRISDQIIVLDVRNISRGAYVISTNLGGAKFMK